jgi:hypothetical protein
MKSMPKDGICYSLTCLVTAARIQPKTLYLDVSLIFLQDVSQKYPSIKFLCHQHNEAMNNNEREIFMIQLHKWINNDKNLVCGVSVIQAVTNTMPIKPV